MKHPISMKTVFRDCLLVNFAVDPVVMAPLIPAPLALDIHDNRAWLSIVIADMEKMRPAFLCECLGVTYLQVVYRVVVQYQGERGVYFLRSDSNSRLMSIFGNLLTYFHFHTSRIVWDRTDRSMNVELVPAPGQNAGIVASFDLTTRSKEMPENSSFHTLREAQEFLAELYQAFSVAANGTVNRVRIKRGEWNIGILRDQNNKYEFMQSGEWFNKGNSTLDSVFYVQNLPYYWYPLEKVSATAI